MRSGISGSGNWNSIKNLLIILLGSRLRIKQSSTQQSSVVTHAVLYYCVILKHYDRSCDIRVLGVITPSIDVAVSYSISHFLLCVTMPCLCSLHNFDISQNTCEESIQQLSIVLKILAFLSTRQSFVPILWPTNQNLFTGTKLIWKE